MRKPRFTYTSAFHYINSKARSGTKIFPDDFYAVRFLKFLEGTSDIYKVEIFAFCLTENSFHLLLKNTSGKLSDFLRQLNSQFASHVRKKTGTKGNVFCDRYESFVIQDNVFFTDTLAYLLNIPLKYGKTADPFSYRWSSANFYFNQKGGFLKTGFVESLFRDSDDFRRFVREKGLAELPKKHTERGKIIGDGKWEPSEGFFIENAKTIFKKPEEILLDIERKHGILLEFADFKKKKWKDIRSQILVELKDECGMIYRDIKGMKIFDDVKLSSMGQLYKRAKKRKSHF